MTYADGFGDDNNDDDDDEVGSGDDLSGAIPARHASSAATLVASFDDPRVRHSYHSHLPTPRLLCHRGLLNINNWLKTR